MPTPPRHNSRHSPALISGLHKTASYIDTFNEFVGGLIGWFTLVMVLVTFLVVLLRYGFDLGWIAMQESIIYMHAFVFMAGAAYTLRHNGHVRVDIFYTRMSASTQAWINLLGTLGMLLPVCIFILWVSWDYVVSSWMLMEGSREAGGLPLVFLLKSFIPLLVILLGLQGISVVCHSLLTILARPRVRDGER